MKTVTKIVMFLMMLTMPVMANDIYVTQSGATLTLDVLQDGQNNTIGNSTTASTVTGATSNFNIDQIGDSNFNCDSGGTVSSCATVTASIVWVGSSNDLDIDVGETADATGAGITISGASGSDSNVINATIDGTSVILTLSVNGDTNNYLLDIDGDGDSAGHTLIHTHTGSIADVDITQSGIYDNMITLTTSGDNHDIDIIQRD